ncbi:MAG: CPBP family intramembrane glutamic endopeptidase [Acidimicrobiales bacterium]
MVHTLGAVVSVAFALFLVVVAPMQSRRRFAALLEAVTTDPTARLRFYRRTVLRQWPVTLGALALIGLLTGRGPSNIGVRLPAAGHSLLSTGIIVAIIALIAGGVLVTVVARRPGGGDILRNAMGPAAVLLPTTARERRVFLLVSVTAGVTEELAFRGFLLAFMQWVAPDAARGWLVLASGVAFGVAHVYQGARGAITTGIVGALLADTALSSGSLMLPAVIHTVLDARWSVLPGFGQTVASPPTAVNAPAESI